MDHNGIANLVEQGPVLVKYWRPGCPPCNALAPVWDKVRDKGIEGVMIHDVNTTDHGVAAGVTGVPTIRLLQNGQTLTYDGPRNPGAIQNWVNEQRQNNPPTLSGPVETLRGAIANNVRTVVKFFTESCPHCVNLAPKWNALEKEEINGVKLMDIDVAKYHGRGLDTLGISNMYMTGVPAIVMFADGKTEAYSGDRSTEAMATAFRNFGNHGANAFGTSLAGGGGHDHTVLRRTQKLNPRGLLSLFESNKPAVVSFDDGYEHPILQDLKNNKIQGTEVLRVNYDKHYSGLANVVLPDGTQLTDRVEPGNFIVLDGAGGAHTYKGDMSPTAIRAETLKLLRGRDHEAGATVARELYDLEQAFSEAKDAFEARIDTIRTEALGNTEHPKLFGGGANNAVQGLLASVERGPRDHVKSTVGAWVDRVSKKKE